MDGNLELCIKLNDIFYECKIHLDKKNPLQAKIDSIMSEYQKYFLKKDLTRDF